MWYILQNSNSPEAAAKNSSFLGDLLLVLTAEVAHFLSMSFVAPGGGVILLNNPVLSRGVGTNNVFLLFKKKDSELQNETGIFLHILTFQEQNQVTTVCTFGVCQ